MTVKAAVIHYGATGTVQALAQAVADGPARRRFAGGRLVVVRPIHSSRDQQGLR